MIRKCKIFNRTRYYYKMMYATLRHAGNRASGRMGSRRGSSCRERNFLLEISTLTNQLSTLDNSKKKKIQSFFLFHSCFFHKSLLFFIPFFVSISSFFNIFSLFSSRCYRNMNIYI